MATIIKRSASRSSIREGLARTNLITINSQGLISGIQAGTAGNYRDTNVAVMGYAGDHNVTLFKFQLDFPEISDSELLTRYRGVVIFKKEGSEDVISLPITGTTNDLSIPKTVTQKGSYQIHYVLQEIIDAGAKNADGHLGSEDEPAFREIFVSDVFSGVVLDSGYSLVNNWDSDDVYNYEMASVILDDWNENGSNYTSSFVAQGIKSTVTADDIVIEPATVPSDKISIFPPEDLISETLTVTYTPSSKTILFSDGVSHQGKEIKVIYPVVFTTPEETSTVRKPNIDLIWTRGQNESLIAEQGEYSTPQLGIKLDSYITAINIEKLVPLLSQSESNTTVELDYYIIFVQEDRKYICPTYNNLCWIPLGVTHNSGLWQVSVVATNSNYTFYNGILQLSVKDSFLTRQDISNEDVSAVALYDSEEFVLADYNNAQLYVTEVVDLSKRVLNFTGAQIEANLNFVSTLAASYTADQIVSKLNSLDEAGYDQDIADLERGLDELEGTVSSIQTTVGNHTNQLAALTSADTELSNRIDEIEDISADLSAETTARTSADTTLQRNIDTLTNELNTYKTATNTAIELIKDKNAEQSTNIAQHTLQIEGLNAEDEELLRQIGLINTAIADYGNYKSMVHTEIADRAAADAILTRNLNDEIARAQTAEATLQTNIESEASRASVIEGQISSNLTAEINRATAIEESLQNQITSNDNDIIAINQTLGDHNELLSGQGGRISGLETQVTNINNDRSIVRNDYSTTETKTIVAKIVFIEPDIVNNLTAEQVYEALVAAGQIDNNTLYLIQEEE